MAEPRLIREVPLAPEVLEVTDRLRPVTEAGVAAILASVSETGGIRDAIHVREIAAKGDRPKVYRLIAGAHRLEAARRLGIEIPAKVWHCTADQARLMEIDDQIAGSGLTALDTAVFLARRKAVYEKLYPQSVAKTGAALAAARWNAADIMSVASFATVTAAQFGLTDRHVRRLVAVGTSLSPQDISTLRGAERPIQLQDLMVLSKIGDPSERSAICGILASGRVKSARDARAAHAGREPDVRDPAETSLQTLLIAWDRAPLAARRRFLRHRQDDLQAAGLTASSEATSEAAPARPRKSARKAPRLRAVK